MRDLTEIRLFVRALVRHGVVFLTSSLLIAGVSVVEHRLGTSISWPAYVVVLVFALMWSCFQTWKELLHTLLLEQQAKGDALQALDARGREKEIDDTLGQFFATGDQLHKAKISDEEQLKTWVRDFERWQGAVEVYLDRQLSAAHRALFDHEPPRRLSSGLHYVSAYNEIHNKHLHRLAIFLENLKTLLERRQGRSSL